MSFESAFSEVATLVENFRNHETEYLNPRYQESECRQSFIDKFFIALGWDVYHHQQTNPREQEVKIERGDGMSTRRADYAFYLKPDYQRPQFLVEAKKPSVVLAMPDNYFQTARYGFNTSTSVALLTNFRELHIIDCRRKPENTAGIVDSAKLRIYKYEDYLDRDLFGEIYWTFSHEALEQGKLKEYRKSLPKPKGKSKQVKVVGDALAPVDDQFLAELDEHRKTLASAFKKSNPQLSAEELTEAAQKVLDRLVFIRFLEDKMIEPDFILDKFCARGAAWKRFVAESKLLDKKYNGVVFKDHFIDRSNFAPPDDERFFDICEEMCHQNSPYLFSYIPVEILGSIYERFLGKVVVAKGRGIAVEEKPEVRKAGGVYYTPKYIVDYIVENTVGKILEGKTPREISKLHFADIACGSGSFLIAVFDTIVHYLELYYNAHQEEAKKAKCREVVSATPTIPDPAGNRIPDTGHRFPDPGHRSYTLSLEQKRRILTDNIFGVDIDHQAVEVAQFSLFLKLLESESISTAEAYQTDAFTTADRTILPDLTKNILCGNSLVEYDIAQLFPLTPEEEERIKPFSFQQSFKEIMQAGGFDAIVGNPPYRMLQPHNTTEQMLEYLRSRFFAADFKVDFFHLFLQRAASLLRDSGKLGYIIPSSVLNNVYVEKLRNWILDHSAIKLLAVHLDSVFKGADVHTCVLALDREDRGSVGDKNIMLITRATSHEYLSKNEMYEELQQVRFREFKGTVWNVLLSERNASLIQKLESSSDRLGDIAKINRGLITGNRDKYFANEPKNSKYAPILTGSDVNRYFTKSSSEFVLFQRPKTSGGCWDKEVHFAPHKILVRQIGTRPTASFLAEPIAVTGNIFTVMHKDLSTELHLLAILNSNLIKYYWQIMFSDFKSSFPQVTIFSLSQVPVRRITTSDSQALRDLKGLEQLSSQMIETKKLHARTQSDSQREQLQRKCDYLDAEIDRLVYQLYGLTEEEIGIVEGRG